MAALMDANRFRHSFRALKHRMSDSFRKTVSFFKRNREPDLVNFESTTLQSSVPAVHFCRTSLIGYQQTWTIDDFSFYFDESFVGPPILYSVDFASPENPAVKVHMNLKTRSVVDRQCMSLFLNWTPTAQHNQGFCLVFKFSILDVHGVKQHSRASIKQFTPTDRSWGWNNFIQSAILLDPSNGLLKSDKLRILCEIKHLNCKDTSPEAFSSDITEFPTQLTTRDFSQWAADLYDTGKLTDVTIVVDGTELRAHKLCLASASPVFEAMFEHDMAEKRESRVEISDCRVEVFKRMLDWIYAGRVEGFEEIAEELLVAADKFQMDHLKKLCEDSLISSLTIADSSDLLQLATMYGANKLKAAVNDFVNLHIQMSLQTLQTDPVMAIQVGEMLSVLMEKREVKKVTEDS